MTIKDMFIVSAYGQQDVVGRITLNERVEEELAHGECPILSATLRPTDDGFEVIGMSIGFAPREPVRTPVRKVTRPVTAAAELAGRKHRVILATLLGANGWITSDQIARIINAVPRRDGEHHPVRVGNGLPQILSWMERKRGWAEHKVDGQAKMPSLYEWKITEAGRKVISDA